MESNKVHQPYCTASNDILLKMQLDSNATGFLRMVLGKIGITYHLKVDIIDLGKHYVMWRNEKTIEELASNNNNVPKYERKEKLKKYIISRRLC